MNISYWAIMAMTSCKTMKMTVEVWLLQNIADLPLVMVIPQNQLSHELLSLSENTNENFATFREFRRIKRLISGLPKFVKICI